MPIKLVSHPDAVETVDPKFFFVFFSMHGFCSIILSLLFDFPFGFIIGFGFQFRFSFIGGFLFELFSFLQFILYFLHHQLLFHVWLLCCIVTMYLLFSTLFQLQLLRCLFPQFLLTVCRLLLLSSFIFFLLDSYSRSFFNFFSFFIFPANFCISLSRNFSLALNPPSWSPPVFLLAASSVFLVFGLQYLQCRFWLFLWLWVYLSISLVPFSFYFDSQTSTLTLTLVYCRH